MKSLRADNSQLINCSVRAFFFFCLTVSFQVSCEQCSSSVTPFQSPTWNSSLTKQCVHIQGGADYTLSCSQASAKTVVQVQLQVICKETFTWTVVHNNRRYMCLCFHSSNNTASDRCLSLVCWGLFLCVCGRIDKSTISKCGMFGKWASHS